MKKREVQAGVLQAICDVRQQLPEHRAAAAPAFHNSLLPLSPTGFPVLYRALLPRSCL